jgi:hypothetical protein
MGLKRDEVKENGGNCTVTSFIICTHPTLSLSRSSQGERGRQGMWNAWERREKFWWEIPKERDHSEDQGVGGRKVSECILERLAGGSVDWIRLAQDRDWWLAVVNAVMNLMVLAPRS